MKTKAEKDEVTDEKEVTYDIIRSDSLTNKHMRMNRRTFVKMAAMATGALALSNLKLINEAMASAQVPSQIPFPGASILKYVDPLPVFGPASGINPVTGLPNIPRVNGSSPVNVIMQPLAQQVLSTGTLLPGGAVGPASGKTNVWVYNINGIPNYPAVTVEATKGTPTQMIYDNKLNSDMYKYLTVDQTLHWADPQNTMDMLPYTGADVPAVVHLHGGEVPATIDGGPDAWWTNTPAFIKGSAYYSDPGAGANQAIYTYPNVQGSTTLFFHDHALGATRINVHAGLAAFYFIRDPVEAAIIPPLPGGKYEIEIAIQDRMFDTTGQWLFPDTGVNPGIHPFWVPEFFGDAIVVNGKTWPYLNVEPRRYRLRFVNGSNARFYNLRSKVEFWQIGTDGGLLDTPVKVNNLLLGPGERADIIVDFFKVAEQDKVMNITLTNNAATPYPVGLPVVKGTTDQILQFRVGKAPLVPVPDPTFNPTKKTALRTGINKIVRLVNPTTGVLAPGVIPAVKRSMTLNEWLDPITLLPLEMLLNNTKYDGKRPDGSVPVGFVQPDPAIDTWYSEIVQEGTTEVWEIINLTVDAHPMHLHLVQFQLLNRQVFDTIAYQAAYDAAFGGAWIPENGPPNPYNTPNASGYIGGNPDVTPFLIDPVTLLPSVIMPPNQNERGWKDTVVMMPGQVTRIAVRFAPLDKPIADPNLYYYPFNPSPPGSHGYVWHCHIIDHEDNEMMRPYFVNPPAVAPLAPTVAITAPAIGFVGAAGTAVSLSGTPAYAPGLTGTVNWTAQQIDPITLANIGTQIPIGIGLTQSWILGVVGTYIITATAKDSRGNTVSANVTITVA